MNTWLKRKQALPMAGFALWLGAGATMTALGQPAPESLENQFHHLPMEARRLTGPLFWLHGDETRERLEMDSLEPEAAAKVTINENAAGGFIGQPLRLDITPHLKPGRNTIAIEPFAPRGARLAVYAR